MDTVLEIFTEAVTDTLKLIPFLYLTYFLMELLERKTSERNIQLVQSVGRWGPLIGGTLGIIPQCGFSAAASSMYAAHIINMGTVIAIFLSTSDEMLPIFISHQVPLATMIKILVSKAFIAVITGFIVEAVYVIIKKIHHNDLNIKAFCEQENCDEEDAAWLAALKHTLTIVIFIFIFSVIIEGIIDIIGKEALKSIFTGIPILGEMIAGLVGLIPNCAASVVITELYLEGIINSGCMMSGLLVGAGVGLLVLFRLNKNTRENIAMTFVLYGCGVIWGVIINLLNITF